MKRTIRKLSLILVLISMVVLFTACGDKTKEGDLKKVRLWCQPFTEVETRTWLQQRVDEFNQTDKALSNGFEIELTFVAEDAWEQTLKAAQSSGTAPEITVLNYAEVALNSIEGYYTPLDEYMSKSCFDDLLDNVEAMTNVNGNHFIYPWFVEPDVILFYRKSAFRNAGLDPEVGPKSWSETYEYAKRLNGKSNSSRDNQYGIAMPNSSQLGWVLWGFQAQDKNSLGYYMLDENWSRAAVNTKFHTDLFTFFKNVYDDKLTPQVALTSYNEITPLAQGYVAMAFGGSWSIGQIKNNYPEVLDDIGYVVCPTIDGQNEGVTTTALGGWGMAIDGAAKHPKECGIFLEWLLGGDPNILTDFMKKLGYSKFAARKSVEEALSKIDEAQNDPFYRFVSANILPYAKAEPTYIWEISRKYADALEKVTQLKAEVTPTLRQLETDLNNLIEAEEMAGTNPFKK